MYTMHSVEAFRPSQSRLSRQAAERYAIRSALRARKRALRAEKRSRRGSAARRLLWTPTLLHSR